MIQFGQLSRLIPANRMLTVFQTMSFMIYELPGYIQKTDGTLITHMILLRRLVPELKKLMVDILLCNDDMEFTIIIEET